MYNVSIVLKIENVDLYFKNFHALKDINLEIKKGERVAFIGHNGAGKSTLVDVLIGIKKPTKGKIEYNLGSKNKNIKDILGVQFQTKTFPEGLKVKHLLDFYLDLKGLKITDKSIQNLLNKFYLSNLLNVPLKRLSGGQKQKFNIMTMLISDPEIIVVDEIVTGLDITSQESIISLIEDKLKKDKNLTFITVSHNVYELEKLVDRVIVLESGKIINDSTIDKITKKYKTLDKYFKTLVKYEKS